MEYNIAVVKGDGIGPEIVTEAMQVLDKIGEKFGHTFHYQEVLAGGCSIDANGVPLTDETIEICKNADSVLLGAVGVPVFAGFQSGVARLAGPTGGYLVVFPFVSLLVAVMMLVYDRKLYQKSAFLRGSYMAAAMLLSLVVCYVVGTAWYMVYAGTSFVAALSLTALPFIPGDLAKIVLCAVLALSLRPRIKKILL